MGLRLSLGGNQLIEGGNQLIEGGNQLIDQSEGLQDLLTKQVSGYYPISITLYYLTLLFFYSSILSF